MNFAYFEALCCGEEPLWDFDLTWNTTDPQFTPCFQKTVLSWLPCVALLLLSPFEVYFIHTSRAESIPHNWLNISKTASQIICTILGLLSTIQLKGIIEVSHSPLMNYITPVLHVITYVVMLVFTILERRKGLHTSGVQFLFWLVSVISASIIYKHFLAKVINKLVVYDVEFVVYILTCPLILIQFVLNCITDNTSKPGISKCGCDNLEKSKTQHKISPELSASFLSSFFCLWFTRFIVKGFRQDLELKDLWSLNPKYETQNVFPTLDKYLQKEIRKFSNRNNIPVVENNTRNEETVIALPMQKIHVNERTKNCTSPNILKVLLRAFGNRFFIAVLVKFMADMLALLSPMMFNLLIDFSKTNDPQWHGYFLAGVLFVNSATSVTLIAASRDIALGVGLQVKVALTSAIYRKTLRLCSKASQMEAFGSIVNMFAADLQRLFASCMFASQVLPSFFQVALATYLLWQIIGLAVLAVVTVLILLFVISISCRQFISRAHVTHKNSLLIDFSKTNDPQWHGYFLAGVLFVNSATSVTLIAASRDIALGVGLQVKVALTSAIYRKTLRLCSKASQMEAFGSIVNMFAADLQRLFASCMFASQVLPSFFQVALATYLLWQIIGLAVLAVVTVLILLFVISISCRQFISRAHMHQMTLKDKRAKFMNEILNGIKVIKLNAWEPYFITTIQEIRSQELAYVHKEEILECLLSFGFIYSATIISVLVYPIYVLMDSSNILDATVAFVSLSYIGLLQFHLVTIPPTIQGISQAIISLRRISQYFLSKEFCPYVVRKSQDKSYAISIENATFSWNLNTLPVLNNINLGVKPGTLVAIIGQVGAGKSSLISAVLGEMEKLTGTVTVSEAVAYVSQQTWLLNDTIKNNILFGKPFQATLYKNVLQSCALIPDLNILPAGDKTEIGDKGIILSGGQKQRVSLARAAYSEADVFLLDDPLSAVDVHVGAHLFTRVIGPDGLLKNKTRLLVTHHITYLAKVDMIVFMKEGTIVEVGTYQEILQKKKNVEAISDYLASTENESKAKKELEQNLKPKNICFTEEKNMETFKRSVTECNQAMIMNSAIRQNTKVDRNEAICLQKGKLAEENRQFGQVKFSTYMHYVCSMGYKAISLILLLYIIPYGFFVASKMWLSNWTNDQPTDNGLPNTELQSFRLDVYVVLGLTFVILMFANGFARVSGIVNAARKIHCYLLHNVLRLPMSFFDVTPLGRIINRFTKDIDAIDLEVPDKLKFWLPAFFEIGTAILLVCIVSPVFLAALVPIVIVYYFSLRCFTATASQLQRLESVTRSSIYSHLSETISGAATIRAFGKQEHFISQSGTKVDNNSVCFSHIITGHRWNAVCNELLGNLLVLFATLFVVHNRQNLNPGLIGLAISSAISITGNMNRLVRTSSDLETSMVAVERIKEYTSIPAEAIWMLSNEKTSDDWPSHGGINFIDYCAQYRHGLNLVLRHITCNIKSGEKVGIVGRTGSGKSSLVQALFRIIESTDGCIIIDGEDISKIGLHNLRSKLTIIPQDPFLFSGTIRSNVDPLDLHSDDEVWQALEMSQLKTFVKSVPGSLLHEIAGGGKNLSVGQQQLVCLARALLRKSKILVLDEVSSAIDLETDAFIQSTMLKEFAECTVLTIAHRLNTIMDYDRIIVMDNGMIVEFDSPIKLLQDESSIFHSMAKEARII